VLPTLPTRWMPKDGFAQLFDHRAMSHPSDSAVVSIGEGTRTTSPTSELGTPRSELWTPRSELGTPRSPRVACTTSPHDDRRAATNASMLPAALRTRPRRDKPRKPSPRKFAMAVAVAASVIDSPDPLLTQIAERYAASVFVVLMWRCALVALIFGALTLWNRPAALRTLWAHPLKCVLAASFQASMFLGYTLAVCYTQTARAMVLIGVAPLHAALLGWLFLGDGLPLHTRVSLALTCLAVGCIYLGAADEHPGEVHSQREQAVGDVIALVAGVGFGGYLTTVRAITTSARGPAHTDTSATGALAGLAASSIAGFVAVVLHREPLPGILSWKGAVATVLIGAAISAFYFLMQFASRFVKSAELSMVWLVSACLGPVWVHVGGYNATPYSPWTIAAFLLVIATLGGHEVCALRMAAESASGATAAAAADMVSVSPAKTINAPSRQSESEGLPPNKSPSMQQLIESNPPSVDSLRPMKRLDIQRALEIQRAQH